MVYDCFAFFNELDLLDIRLHELDAVVDRFVIVEATRTFQKNPKPLVFEENKERYAKFLPKIIHVVVDEYPGFFAKFRSPSPRDYDHHQKEFILKGIKDAAPDDTIIISDLDEIPHPEKIKAFKDQDGVKVFEQYFFYYFLNCLCVKTPPAQGPEWWRGPVMLQKKYLKTVRKARALRGKEGEGITIVREGGWHFSYMGGIDSIIKKIEALSHDEFNKEYYKNPDRISKIMDTGKDLFDRDQSYIFVKADESFPLYLLENINKYSHLIKSIDAMTYTL